MLTWSLGQIAPQSAWHWRVVTSIQPTLQLHCSVVSICESSALWQWQYCSSVLHFLTVYCVAAYWAVWCRLQILHNEAMLLGSQTSASICHSIHSWMQSEYNVGPCHLNSTVTFVQPTLGSLYSPHIKCSHLKNINIESWSLYLSIFKHTYLWNAILII
jgi:hypothetical protein